MGMRSVSFGDVIYGHGDIFAVLPPDFQKEREPTGKLLQGPMLFYVSFDEMNDAVAISSLSWEVARAISEDKLAGALDRIGWPYYRAPKA